MIHNTVTSIGDSAFDGSEHLTVCVTEGSYAEKYAKKNKIPVVVKD